MTGFGIVKENDHKDFNSISGAYVTFSDVWSGDDCYQLTGYLSKYSFKMLKMYYQALQLDKYKSFQKIKEEYLIDGKISDKFVATYVYCIFCIPRNLIKKITEEDFIAEKVRTSKLE